MRPDPIEHALDIIGLSAVATEQPVIAHDPEVVFPRDRFRWCIGNGVGIGEAAGDGME